MEDPKVSTYVTMHAKTYKIPLYGGKWKIILCDSLSEVEKSYNLEAGSTHGYDAICMTRGTKHMYATAFEIGRVTPGIITHECVHLLNNIFVHNGVELDRENDEHQAYFMGWLVNRVHEFYNKIKKDEISN